MRKEQPDAKMNVLDWVHLPSGARQMSLWLGLHDSELVSIRSFLLEGGLSLILEIPQVCEFHNLPSDLQFMFNFAGVESVRAMRYFTRSHEHALPPTLSPPAALDLAQAWTKWREESFSWSELEARLRREHEQYIDIVDATLATGLSNQVALYLKGYLNHSIPYELFIRAKELSILRSDGEGASLEELNKMGAAYWEHLESNGKK